MPLARNRPYEFLLRAWVRIAVTFTVKATCIWTPSSNFNSSIMKAFSLYMSHFQYYICLSNRLNKYSMPLADLSEEEMGKHQHQISVSLSQKLKYWIGVWCSVSVLLASVTLFLTNMVKNTQSLKYCVILLISEKVSDRFSTLDLSDWYLILAISYLYLVLAD